MTAVMERTGEAAFETVIEAHLLANGYVSIPGDAFDRERAIFPAAALDFIRRTQPKEWGRLEALLGPQTGAQILTDLCSWLDAHGALATLRHGFKCYGRTLYAAFFKAAHDLNPELNARYAANRTGITRQLRFSPHSQQSLDVTLERQRHSGRHPGAEEPAHRADGRGCPPAVPHGPRPAGADLRLQAAHPRPLRRGYRVGANDDAARR